jgi:hypothetical protein
MPFLTLLPSPLPPVGSLPAQSGNTQGRATRLRLANTILAAAWRRGWSECPTLDPDALLSKAELKTGRPVDQDDGGWRKRLDLLCQDLEEVAALTPLGRTIAHGQLVAALSNRIRLQALWQRCPEIAEQPIKAPIIIVGQMRSGTTRIQRLLACDPRLTFTRFFESWNPLPRSTGPVWIDDRKLRGWLAMMGARSLNPAFDTIHPTRWDAPDEEIGFQSVSIFGSAFEVQWRVPNYCAAVEADDGLTAYSEFRRLLQTIAWLRRDDGSRPWILKVPQFCQDLPAVLRAFPDARLICLRRDPQQVIASSASLVRNQMEMQSSRVDPKWIGREWARKVAIRQERVSAGRSRSDAPQIDVEFDDVDRDWVGEITRIYQMLRLPLSPSLLSNMGSYMDRSRRGSHARHTYQAHEFGLPFPAGKADGEDNELDYDPLGDRSLAIPALQ